MSDPSKQSLSRSSAVTNQNFAMMPSPISSVNSLQRIQGLQDFSSIGLSSLPFPSSYLSPNMFGIYQENQYINTRQTSFSKDDKDDVGTFGLSSQSLSTYIKEEKDDAGSFELSNQSLSPYVKDEKDDVDSLTLHSQGLTSFIKEEKDTDVGSLGLHSRPLSAPGLGCSPKSFGTYSPNPEREKGEKLNTAYDRTDIILSVDKGMSPLSIVAVSTFPDGGHPSPAGSGSHQAVLRYQPSGDAMLSAINYESEILQEGTFDAVSGTLSSLEDGLMGNLGVGNTNTNTNSPFNLFDGDGGQETYIETNQDLQLSPQTFSNNPDAFNENSNLSGVTETGTDNTVNSNEETVKTIDNSKLTVDKNKKNRPNKATSPNRQGAQACPQCGKVFSNSSALAKHKLTHSDERKYVCQLCSKAFKRQDHLNGHMLTHRNKKPYECKVEGCGKSYCDARSLRRHTENHHSNTGAGTAIPVTTVTVIPTQGTLNMAAVSLANSLPYTEKITVGGNAFVTNVTISDRIQYAPPPPYSSASNNVSVSAVGSVAMPTTSETSTTAAGHLQILAAFQQQDATDLLNWSDQQQQQQQQQQQLFIQQSFGDQVFSEPSVQSPQTGTDGYLSSQASTSSLDIGNSIHTPLSQHNEPCLLAQNQSHTIRIGMPQVGSNDQQVTLSQEQAAALQHSSQLLTSELVNQTVLQTSQLQPQSLNSNIQVNQQQQQQQQHQQRLWNQTATFNATSSNFGPEPKPVECTLCHRKFKNIPALNGHMRLHGGYFKKDTDSSKKNDKKTENSGHHPPLTTASMNVRALIEEKIIQRRIVNPQLNAQNIGRSTNLLNNEYDNAQNFTLPNPGNNGAEMDHVNLISRETQFPTIRQGLETLRQGLLTQQAPVEKFRRHSDSDHFLAPRRPVANTALVDMLRRKVVGKRTQRTGSDPGEPIIPNVAHSPVGTLPSSPTPQSPLTPPVLQTNFPSSIPNSPTTPTTPNAQWPLFKSQDLVSAVTSCRVPTPSTTPVPSTVTSLSTHILTVCTASTATTSTNSALSVPKLRIDREDDDDVFLNPSNIPTSPIRAKKKHRPEPLYIPPHVSTTRFPSQLRSPRLWDPCVDGKMGSPPPYTPPPMLSPVRSGSGLFWHIVNSGSLTPKSAPITPRFSISQRVSTSEAAPAEEEEISEPPETDIHPHVNLGSQYQAVLPEFRGVCSSRTIMEAKEDLIWDPKVEENISEEEMDAYLDFACCAAVPGGGRNKEYALLILHLTKGNIQEAMLRLMDSKPSLPRGHQLLTYKMSECDKWSTEEIEAYHQALSKCDKDFFTIAQEIGSKTVKECVQFYYLWKKVCPDEYKRLRVIRRRREQENLMYNLRSKGPNDEEDGETHPSPTSVSPANDKDGSGHSAVPERFLCEFPDCTASFISKQALNGHIRIHGGNSVGQFANGPNQNRSPHGDNFDASKDYSVVNNNITTAVHKEVLGEFPCKICGKVFNKVKSRSAHMKSHRPCEADRAHKM